jgi:hypothetical protein
MDKANKKTALDIIIKLGENGKKDYEKLEKETKNVDKYDNPTQEVSKVLRMHPLGDMSDDDIVSLHEVVCKELTKRNLMEDEEYEDEGGYSEEESEESEGE